MVVINANMNVMIIVFNVYMANAYNVLKNLTQLKINAYQNVKNIVLIVFKEYVNYVAVDIT